jgi:IclR family transcriptional regulator, pca regulon regulatory protein
METLSTLPDRRDALFLSSLAKAFHVLEVLAEAGRPMALTELAAKAALDRSAVQRITHTLQTLGYLRQHPSTRAFSLSGKMLTFSHALLSGDHLREVALPHLEALNKQTGETVNLMELEGQQIVYVVRLPGSHPVSVDLHVGSRLPAFCSAGGRAILCKLEEQTALGIMAASARPKMTHRTQTELPALKQILRKARQLGYALNNEESFINDISVASPLLNRQGEVLGAINIAVQASRWTVDEVTRKLVPLLMQTARNIDRTLL